MKKPFYLINVDLDSKYDYAMILASDGKNAIYDDTSQFPCYIRLQTVCFMCSYNNLEAPKIKFNDNARQYTSKPFDIPNSDISIKETFIKGLDGNRYLFKTFVTDRQYRFIRVLKSLPIIISKNQPSLRHIISHKFMEDYNNIFIKKVQEMII